MNNSIYDKLLKKEAKLAVIGLGYVGLPIAL
jgi:UDP-N-acetyl-D-galactosamine dehydrogenase